MANADRENEIYEKGYKIIVGIDEVGYGSLAGPLMVGAVIFPKNIDFASLLPGLNDSKTKTELQRKHLDILIKQYATSWSIAEASVEEIETLNVYYARFLAARRAIIALSVKPDYVFMDGNKIIPEITIPQSAIVKGDQISISIAAASIIAKVKRDEYITELATKVHPDYDWKHNKAYCSPKHIKALKAHGKTEWHRNKFIEKII